jgi:excisionase family DNA binding protein
MSITRSPLVDGSNPFLATGINKHKLGKAHPMPDIAEFMTTQEAAQALGVHVVTIRKMVSKHKLESMKAGTALLILRKSVDQYRSSTSGMEKNDPRRGRKK